MYKIKVFFRRIKNLFRWFPIIWRDQDWDQYFIYEILKFKLKNQAEYIGKKGNHLSAERDAEIMMTCVRLIEKIQEEYYAIEYLDYENSRYKFIDSEEFPGNYEIDIERVSENFDDYFKKYPLVAKKVKEKDKHRKGFEISKINQQRAHKLLFKLLETNIERWWD